MTRALAALLLLALASPLRAQGLGGSAADIVRLEVIPGWEMPDGRRLVGLRLDLAPGWKTYWRSPGAGGLAPVLDLSRSTGIRDAEARWPVPRVFYLGELRSIGYEEGVTIPLALTLEGQTARLEGRMEIGVCQEVCVPAALELGLDLAPAEAGGRRDPALVAALVDQPLTAEEAGASATCATGPGADGALALRLRLDLPPQGAEEVVVVETDDPALWISEATARRDGGVLLAEAEALARDGGPASIDRSALRITVLGEGRAVDIRGCAAG